MSSLITSVRILFQSKTVKILAAGGMVVLFFLQFRKYSGIHSIFKRIYKPSLKYREKKKVHVIESPEIWEEFCHRILKQNIKVIGLDCEWVSHGKRALPVSLLQVATPRGDCGLVRLSKMSEVPESLHQIMQDRSILKVGVAVVDDGKKLGRDYGITVQGCVDLRYVLARVRGIFNVLRV